MKVLKLEKGDNLNARGHRKENYWVKTYKLIGLASCSMVEVAEMRMYSTKTNDYACLWIESAGQFGSAKHKEIQWASGSGKDGTFGYDSASDAAEQAFNGAGITFDTPIAGKGEELIKEAFEALAMALGYGATSNKLLILHA